MSVWSGNLAKPPFMRICREFENWCHLRALSGKFLQQKSCYPESFRFLWLWCQHIWRKWRIFERNWVHQLLNLMSPSIFLQIHTKPNFTATHASHNFFPEEQQMNVICHLLLAEECFTVWMYFLLPPSLVFAVFLLVNFVFVANSSAAKRWEWVGKHR